MKTSERVPFNIPESDISKRLKAGDHDAYDLMFLMYKTPINFFLRKLTRSREIADDITQDVFINLWVKREQIDETKNIKSFLFIIARNAALNYFKREQIKRHTFVELNNADELESSPDEMLIAHEMELLTEIAISKMPRQRRTVYLLSRNEGLSHKEIGLKLEISEESVRSHISLALKDIRELIKLMTILFLP